MACIDEKGNITRSAELILLALMQATSIEMVAKECRLPLFRVRSAIRELLKARLLEKVNHNLYQITSQGIAKVEGQD